MKKYLALLALLFVTTAFAADTKISALTAVTTPASTDEFVVNQGGTSKKQTRAQIHTLESGEQFLADPGSAAAPGIAFNGFADDGMYHTDARLFWSITGETRIRLTAGEFGGISSTNPIFLPTTGSTATVPNIIPAKTDQDTGTGHAAEDALSLIAGGVEGIRITEASTITTVDIDAGDNQTGNVGALTSFKSAVATLTAATGTAITASNLIPDGAIVLGVTTRITTEFGTGNSMTDIQIGDGSDQDYWGALGALTAGITTDGSDATVTTIQRFTSATDVVATAIGGSGYENNVGVIEIIVHYIDLTAPTG